MHAYEPLPVPSFPWPRAERRAGLLTPVRGLQLALFGVSLLVYWFCVRRSATYEGEMLLRVAESLFGNRPFHVQDPVYQLSQPFSPYPLGMSLLVAPLLALGGNLSGDARLFAAILDPALSALTLVVLHRLLMEVGLSARRSLSIALLYGFGTIAWAASGPLGAEPLRALTLTCTVLWLLFFERTEDRRWLAGAGGALAVALLTGWEVVPLMALPLSVYLVYWIRKRSRPRLDWWLDLGAYLGPMLAALTVDAGYDLVRYGRVFGGFGATWAFIPWWRGAYAILVGPGAGLLLFVPVVLLSALGAPAFYRKWRPEAVLVAGLLLIHLAFYSGVVQPDQSGWGPTGLLPVLPLLMIPIAFLPKHSWIRAVVVLLVASGVGIELLEQVVPFGLYYQHLLQQALPGIQDACPGCNRWQATVILSEQIRLDWAYWPFAAQLRLLLDGVADPLWKQLVLFVPSGLCLLGVAFLQLRRLAAAVDSTPRLS